MPVEPDIPDMPAVQAEVASASARPSPAHAHLQKRYFCICVGNCARRIMRGKGELPALNRASGQHEPGGVWCMHVFAFSCSAVNVPSQLQPRWRRRKASHKKTSLVLKNGVLGQ